MPAVIIWAEGPTFSASEQSLIFTPRQVTGFHPGLERGVPNLLHPPGALACPAWLRLVHKWVGVELRLYATQEMWRGGDPGQTWPRICVQQWGVEGRPKNDDGDGGDDLSCLPGALLGVLSPVQ